MIPVSTGTAPKNYRYYTCGRAAKTDYHSCPVKSVPAGEIEGAVIHQLRWIFRSPEMVAQTYRATRELDAEELERLRSGRSELESRLAELQQTASRLLDSGASDRDTNDEIRRTNEEFVDTQRRFSVNQFARAVPEIWDEQREKYGFDIP